ncbi:MAG TPA: hypothetical protein VF599_23040 [Pyrinomonadaceae bacterium]|jgi:hypothetical protein
MDFRTTAEIEASFRSMEQRLDAMLEAARAGLERERIASVDDSNRSGFDGSGMPSFAWRFRFVKQEDFGSEIKRATVRLRYGEPILKGESQKIEATSVAEIFQIGKKSRVTEIRKMVYPLEQFLDLSLNQVIADFVAPAEQFLAKY